MTAEDDIFIIDETEVGERLDKILAHRFKNVYSRTYFQYLIEEHLVLLNGSPVKKRAKPHLGDEIEIEFAATPEMHLLAENIPLDIVYEDDHMIAINKPVGLVVHPAPGHWSGTFVNALLYHCQLFDQGDLRPGIVHRLDKETSGILIAAKTAFMQQKLIELFATRQIYKEYLAVCIGRPPDGEIHAPIGRHPIHRKQMAVVPTGKKALTICQTLKWNQELSVVKAIIATGRTHQIRVHLKYVGTPILGDNLYGLVQFNKRLQASHQFLHAAVIRFVHPITQKLLELKAKLPLDMQILINKI